MSAYILDRHEISYIIQAALKPMGARNSSLFRWWYHGESFDIPHGGSAAAKAMATLLSILWGANIKSVSYRYPNESVDTLPGPVGEDYSNSRVYGPSELSPLTPGLVFQALDCYEYQSCEHPEWATSEAKIIIDAIRKKWCHYVTNKELDYYEKNGYERTGWGIRKKESSSG